MSYVELKRLLFRNQEKKENICNKHYRKDEN